MQVLRSTILVTVGLLLVSCASVDKKDDRHATASQVPLVWTSAKESADYKEIQELYGAGQYEQALQKINLYERKYRKSLQLGQIRNLRGLIYLITKRPLQAIFYFKKALEANPHPGFQQFVLYNLGAAQFDVNQLDEAELTLKKIDPDNLDRETRMKFHSLKSRVHFRRAQWIDSARQVLMASELIEQSVPRDPLHRQLQETLQKISAIEDLEGLYDDFEEAPLADLVLFRLGTHELTLGKIGPGKAHLKELMARFPQTTRYAEASNLVRSIEEQTRADGTVIGVLLPMNGKFGAFGRQTLNSIELAFRIFNLQEPESKFTLVVEDSGDEPETAIKALNRLFFKHQAVAVIGPLLSKGVDKVTQRAQELALPMVTLSQQPGTKGDYVFQAGLTPQLQTEEIARYAIEQLGLRRFAILHPRDGFGEQYSQHFWNAVEELGGSVVSVESYAPGETDFRQSVDKLSGLYYDEARKREIEELAKLREELNITRRNRRTEKYYSLPPIVDFEAVFIPDGPKVIGQVLPTFAYRDIEGLKFLGTATWHSPELISRAQHHAEGAAFVDAFYSGSESPVVRKFVDGYRQTFGKEPGALDALAYDAARIVEAAVSSADPKSREAVRGRLADLSSFPGVTGRISYRDGRFGRSLSILTVQSGTILQVPR